MEDISRLSEQLHNIDIDHVVPAPPRNALGYSVIGGNPIGQDMKDSANSMLKQSIKQSIKSTRDTNFFYDPKLTLEIAAQHVFQILEHALSVCEIAFSQVTEDAKAATKRMETSNPLILICMDFHHILFFLEHGRREWDLTYLPDNFFADVEGVLAALTTKMQELSEIEGCKVVYRNAIVPLRGVKARLDAIKAVRKRIWVQTKAAYEREQEAREANGEAEKGDLQLVERPKVKAVSRRANGQGVSESNVKSGTDVKLAFDEEQEFKAGGATVTIEAPVQDGVELAVEVKQEVEAGIETEATSEVVHTNRTSEDLDIHLDFALFAEDDAVVEEDGSSVLSKA